MDSSPPQKCYFTLLDSDAVSDSFNRARQSISDYRQIRLKVQAQLRAELQAAVLLHDEVVFRATVVFASPQLPIAHDIVSDARVLIEKGVLVPEVRGGDDALAKQLRDRPAQFGLDVSDAKNFLPLAELIDAAPKKHEPDAVLLSRERSLQLIDHLFQLYCNRSQISFLKKRSLTCEDLGKLFSLLLESRAIPRNDFREKCKQLYKVSNRDFADHLIQTIYYGVGALTAKSDVLLPPQLSRQRGLYPKIKPDCLSKNVRNLADKFGVSERLERPQNLILNGDGFIQPDEILSAIGVAKVGEFEWKDIYALHQSRTTRWARDKVRRLTDAHTLESPLGLKPKSNQTILDTIRGARLEEAKIGEALSLIKDTAAIVPVLSEILKVPAALLNVISAVSSWIGVAGVPVDRFNMLAYFTPLESFKKRAEQTERKYH